MAADYKLGDFIGTHAIGHARMATESDATSQTRIPTGPIRSPTWPWSTTGSSPTTTHVRRRLERRAPASPTATWRSSPSTWPSGWRRATRLEGDARSLDELDGVFTYICVTEDALGVAKDELGAKPLVLYESDDIVALASEEIAIRKVIDREIETYDPTRAR